MTESGGRSWRSWLMTCAASWHAGMAYALGWMRAAPRFIEEEPDTH